MMKSIAPIFLVFFWLLSCHQSQNQGKIDQGFSSLEKLETKPKSFAIVIHGGAGTILRENMSAEQERQYRDKLEEAIKVGHQILKDGGSSLDAVERTINVLEDSPLFNAGKGAVLTNEGTAELDASIMDGKTLNAGASAGTKTVKNPISLARVIMEKSPHVMMASQGADIYANEQGLSIVDPSYFIVENRVQSLKRLQEAEKKKKTSQKQGFYDSKIKDSKFGTVGCVALDKNGNLAAGTSTGGMMNKRWGRVGDSPIIGAGTYANNSTCGVSCTGWGEFFIRGMVAYDISALMAYKGMTLKEAAKEVIQKKVPEMGGDGGLIAIDKTGEVVMEFNTAGMFRASMNDQGDLYIGMFSE
ncbi:isoaspartyl peptidase/L-asparaginase [Mangrovimonas sp. AS39]|nr:isoaspartyl peptidase/L-asparaginase [Mangrovimonas futianensis]MCF1190410.1 isoaspartyl peptidase/L-asparaginase [Mangrovimonas futianensis]MCF1193837.1 isoaspartyl peptidase/L-asparaginase [Mangrovimonas futianensis]